jgi:uncharacterized membrane protein YjfL (UPF0719 family)
MLLLSTQTITDVNTEALVALAGVLIGAAIVIEVLRRY